LEGVDELEPIRKNERILVMAPHPDDEAIACAGIIQKAIDAGAEVKVLYLTNGDHNQVAFIVYEKRLTFRKGEFIHMGQVRHSEAVKAMEFFGLDESRLIFLGYPDFGTFTIFRDYWDAKSPYRSMLTRISHVPYRSNLSYGAPYTGESILGDIKKVLREYRPDKIFVSHPSDTNPDHRAFYLFLQVALWDLEGDDIPPKVYPYLVHCPGWPLPRHYHPKLQLGPPRQYPVGAGIKWLRSDMSSQEIDDKHKAILCYRSQTQSSAFYLLSFARRNELFGNYPTVVLDLKKDVFPASKEWVMPVLPFWKHPSGDPGLDSPYDTVAEQDNKTRVRYECDGANFYIKVTNSDALSRKFGTLIYLFGYSRKVEFAKMPKLRIVTKGRRFKVFDSRKVLKAEGIELSLGEQEFILKIPLAVLKDPDAILTSLKSYGARPRLNSMGFRKVIIKRR